MDAVSLRQGDALDLNCCVSHSLMCDASPIAVTDQPWQLYLWPTKSLDGATSRCQTPACPLQIPSHRNVVGCRIENSNFRQSWNENKVRMAPCCFSWLIRRLKPLSISACPACFCSTSPHLPWQQMIVRCSFQDAHYIAASAEYEELVLYVQDHFVPSGSL